MPLPSEDDFESMRETLGDVVHEPKGRTSVGIARGEDGRHRRSQRFAIALREWGLRPKLARGLLLSYAVGAEKSALRFRRNVLFPDECNVLTTRD